MKKSLLIWCSALILLIVALFVTSNYDKSKNNADEFYQSTATQGSKQTQSNSGLTNNDITSEKAIDFTLMDLKGKKVSLSDFKGKNVYLNFFATWCPPCRAEMPAIEKMYQKYKDEDLVILAVNLGEDRNTVKDFIEKNRYSFLVLLDSNETVGTKYRISAIPVSYFIDKEGNVKAKKVGALSEAEMKSNIDLLYK